MFDLQADPKEQHNLLYDAKDANKPQVKKLFKELKAEIERLQKEFKDDGQYAHPADWPQGSSDRPAQRKALGKQSVAQAIQNAKSSH